jgi:glycosyltransferase involved in cell wall biosynthesis
MDAHVLPLNMDTPPLLTVILPTFHAAAVLGDCLESLVAKSAGSLEVLVMDGGSKDDTLAKASTTP